MRVPKDQLAVPPPRPWLLRLGIVGSIVAALCCFTPVLVLLFGFLGLSAWVGVLDRVLLPALGFFVLLTAYALWRRQRHGC
jgi:mercuric ion transport protein